MTRAHLREVYGPHLTPEELEYIVSNWSEPESKRMAKPRFKQRPEWLLNRAYTGDQHVGA